MFWLPCRFWFVFFHMFPNKLDSTEMICSRNLPRPKPFDIENKVWTSHTSSFSHSMGGLLGVVSWPAQIVRASLIASRFWDKEERVAIPVNSFLGHFNILPRSLRVFLMTTSSSQSAANACLGGHGLLDSSSSSKSAISLSGSAGCGGCAMLKA